MYDHRDRLIAAQLVGINVCAALFCKSSCMYYTVLPSRICNRSPGDASVWSNAIALCSFSHQYRRSGDGGGGGDGDGGGSDLSVGDGVAGGGRGELWRKGKGSLYFTLLPLSLVCRPVPSVVQMGPVGQWNQLHEELHFFPLTLWY